MKNEEQIRILRNELEVYQGLKENLSKVIASLNNELEVPERIFRLENETDRMEYEKLGAHGRQVLLSIAKIERQIAALHDHIE